MIRIDVIVPCYNYGSLLEACVSSVLAQEGVDVRVLIMDDASPDESELVGRRLAARDPRVAYRRHSVNCGHIATYNEALALLSGDYSLILSADDLLTTGALARAARVMEARPGVGLAFGRDITFHHAPPSAGARTASYCSSRIMTYLEFLECSCRLGHTPIQAPTALVRTSLQRKIGGYRSDLPHTADTEIWLRMAAEGSVAELDADQAFRRLHAANMSRDYSPLRRLEEQHKAFAAHFDLYRTARPEIGPFEAMVHRTIAESAFWAGAQAFEDGDLPACDAFLAFASKTDPGISSWSAWRRFRWKRRIGTAAWRWLGPVAARARLKSRDRATP